MVIGNLLGFTGHRSYNPVTCAVQKIQLYDENSTISQVLDDELSLEVIKFHGFILLEQDIFNLMGIALKKNNLQKNA